MVLRLFLKAPYYFFCISRCGKKDDVSLEEAYATVKKELAEKYTYDGALYTEGKNEFVRNVDEKAKEWRKNNVNE